MTSKWESRVSEFLIGRKDIIEDRVINVDLINNESKFDVSLIIAINYYLWNDS